MPAVIFLRLLTAWPALAVADTLTGRAVSIADGDTLTVLDASQHQHKIRLSGIDAPERGQPFGTVSGNHLGERVFGKQVTITYDKRDRYGRIVGKVLDSGHDMNLEQIEAVLARHYKEYQHEQNPLDRQIYADTEIEARRDREGYGRTLIRSPHGTGAKAFEQWFKRRQTSSAKSVVSDELAASLPRVARSWHTSGNAAQRA